MRATAASAGIEDYYADGMAALRFEKLLRGHSTPGVLTPFYEQTADFTCGSACLLMALARYRASDFLDPVWEIRLWREATTVFMQSGPGGCEPYGLAVVAREYGLDPEVWCSTEDMLFLETVRDPEKRRVSWNWPRWISGRAYRSMRERRCTMRLSRSRSGSENAPRGGTCRPRSGEWVSDDGQEGPALGARPWR
jgi:hypothetical protein